METKGEIERKLASLELLRQDLGEALYQVKRSELEQRLKEIPEDLAAPARSEQGQVREAIVVDSSGNYILQGDNISVTLSPDQARAEMLRLYRQALAEDCGHLPLGRIYEEFARPGVESQYSLAQVYTDLDVISAPPEKGGDLRTFGMRLERGEQGERAALLEAAGQEKTRHIALVGGPGSGKSTFVNYLAACLASGRTQDLPEGLQNLLPVRLELRRAAAFIPLDAQRGEAGMLWDALSAEIARLLGKAVAPDLLGHMQIQLKQRGGLVLLDGLDEAPEFGRRRAALLEAIQAWRRDLPKCRFLLTARPYAYADENSRLPDFTLLALAPFNARQKSSFVQSWYRAASSALGWSEEEAGRRAGMLLSALKARPDLDDLASRPLLLTLMAAMHSYKSRMPEDRAELFEFSVGLLLTRWQMGRQEQDETGHWRVDPNIEKTLGLGEERLRNALETLALQTHTRQGQSEPQRDRESLERSADISLGDILVVFNQVAPSDLNADALVRYMEERAGLLVGRGNNSFTFIHRSFQEYLAACRLANTEPDFASALKVRLRQDLDWWREIFLLGVGRVRQTQRNNAIQIVNQLIPCCPDEMPELGELEWRLAALGAEAALELRLLDYLGDNLANQVLLKRLQTWLRALLEAGALAPGERLAAGDLLGRLGDTRTGVGLRKSARIELPEIDWVCIPAGSFIMGSAEGDKQAWEDEKPQHRLELAEFWISRYPLTNQQFRPFIQDGGYERQELWTAEGWAWRSGAEPDFSPWKDYHDQDFVSRYKAWVAGRTNRSQPHWWETPRWGGANRPLVGVTWYEALAFCRWLEAALKEESGAGTGPAAWKAALGCGSLHVHLPSEAEWEKAGRGPQGWRWGWGDEWEEGRANIAEVHLSETSPVGIFPSGGKGYGLVDMNGNVREWTRSQWGWDIAKPDYGYPYRPEDGRESLEGQAARVVRGGSWVDGSRSARCAYRLRLVPSDFAKYLGFRVVLSLAPSGF